MTCESAGVWKEKRRNVQWQCLPCFRRILFSEATALCLSGHEADWRAVWSRQVGSMTDELKSMVKAGQITQVPNPPTPPSLTALSSGPRAAPRWFRPAGGRIAARRGGRVAAGGLMRCCRPNIGRAGGAARLGLPRAQAATVCSLGAAQRIGVAGAHLNAALLLLCAHCDQYGVTRNVLN